MYPNREIFASAPLALVAAEIRFTDAARLRQQQTRDEIAIALEGRFPFAVPFGRTEVTLVAGQGQPMSRDRSGVVLKNARSTESLTILPDSLIYETTAYASFEDLLEALTDACRALEAAMVLPAMQRVGLRYIDEVRVPEPITDARRWSTWINHRLVDHLAIGPGECPAIGTESTSTYDLGEGKGLNVRSAALSEGTVVAPQFLNRPPVASGPFFVLDFDGFRDYTGRHDAVPLSVDEVRRSLDAVHVPCGAAFQECITDQARELFREKQS